ncbi:TPA: hypothetical protein ACF3DY_005136 [Klebsiella quasipneumoniae subsp. similipneumoniae]
MKKNKNSTVAFLSLTSRMIKVFAAPVTLVIISKNLSSEQLAFYYTFFSLLNLQQLAELGMGHVIKQNISHAFKDSTSDLSIDSKKEIREYFKFSLVWFFCLSIFLILVVGFIGYLYLSTTKSSIDWTYAWWALVLVSGMATLLSPFQFFLDALQKQESILKANLVSGLFGSFALWVSLMLNFGLYSISISLVVSSVICVFFIKNQFIESYKLIFNINENVNYIEVFRKIYPLLTRVSAVWAFGFLFWNSFNLLSFLTQKVDVAGKIIFMIAIARSGMNVAESITQGQATIFSNLISSGRADLARIQFKKYSNYSMLLLISGYSFFFVVWTIYPNLYLFHKVPDKIIVIQVFIFFTLQLYKMIRTNFVRNFKVEPFVKPSIFEAIFMPLTFYFSLLYIPNYSFIMCSIVIFIGMLWSFRIENSFLKGKI